MLKDWKALPHLLKSFGIAEGTKNVQLEWIYGTISKGPRLSHKLLTFTVTLPQATGVVSVRKKPGSPHRKYFGSLEAIFFYRKP